MKSINEIKTAYQNLGAINTLDKALKKEKELSILDILIVKMAFDSNEFIRKTTIEKTLNVSPSMTQKSTKRLRKERLIIKDRDIDDESIIIIGMDDEMREKAKKIFEEVESIQKDILEGESKDKEDKEDKEAGNKDVVKPNVQNEKHMNKKFK